MEYMSYVHYGTLCVFSTFQSNDLLTYQRESCDKCHQQCLCTYTDIVQ